ncbi:unnamed protein product [Fusarium graminearum]|nr:unnamed protein product [Fusarium graminearum]
MLISGLSTICTPFPVLETGMVQMTGLQGTVRTVSVGSAAGLMTAIADCKGDVASWNTALPAGKHRSVIPGFVLGAQKWRAGMPISQQGIRDIAPFLHLRELTVAVDDHVGCNRIPAINRDHSYSHSYSNMKPFIFIAAVLKVAEVVSANGLAVMETPVDTWCITYLSTYLAAVTNQAGLSPTDRPDNEVLSAQSSGRLPFAPSIRPTFARNTSVSITRSTMSTEIGPDGALFTSDVVNTADTSPVNSESSDLDVDPTAIQSSSAILTLTDSPSTAVTPTTDAAATTTAIDIIEPAGRNVIFLIRTTENQKRSFYKRANNGFVGDNNPDVCTFAATFNLADGEGQLFAKGLPIHYAGEDFKELSAQGRPPRGSVTSGFTDSGGSLVFRNSELPSGEAGFCQDADGQVYITFTTGPSGCTPVSLSIYNVEQCQNGRLVGLGDLTSSGSGTVTATAENILSTQSTSGALPESTGLVSSDSISSAYQTSKFEASATVTESSTQGPGDASSQETSASTAREDVETLSSLLTTLGNPASEPPTASTSQLATETSDLLDSTTESQATTGVETSGTETTIMTSFSETTVIPVTTETTGVDTSSTEAISDIDTITTDIEDTTTANTEITTLPEDPTTAEAETTTEEMTTTADPTTTTGPPPEPTPQFACGDAGFTETYTYSGVTFDVLCDRGFSYFPLDNVVAASYGECMRRCALNGACDGVVWEEDSKACSLTQGLTAIGEDNQYDLAKNSDSGHDLLIALANQNNLAQISRYIRSKLTSREARIVDAHIRLHPDMVEQFVDAIPQESEINDIRWTTGVVEMLAGMGLGALNKGSSAVVTAGYAIGSTAGGAIVNGQVERSEASTLTRRIQREWLLDFAQLHAWRVSEVVNILERFHDNLKVNDGESLHDALRQYIYGSTPMCYVWYQAMQAFQSQEDIDHRVLVLISDVTVSLTVGGQG